MSDPQALRGLLVPPLFFGMHAGDPALPALRALGDLTGMGDPRGVWFMADNLLAHGRTRGFLTDPRFVEAVLAANPTAEERAIVWRTHTLCWAADQAAPLPGDFVECGSYQGYSAEVLIRFSAGLPGRQFWLYDLFNPTGGAGEGYHLPAHAPGLADHVRARFAAWRNVVVTQGKVPEVLTVASPERIAFLHLDMNNAQAERGALEALFDRVAQGGVIVFDDYGWSGYRAQKAAADEFMRARSLSVLELPTGQGLVVKR